MSLGSHLQYLRDAIDRLHDEEDNYVESFILDIPLNPIALVFISVWHFVFACLYVCLVIATRQKAVHQELENDTIQESVTETLPDSSPVFNGNQPPVTGEQPPLAGDQIQSNSASVDPSTKNTWSRFIFTKSSS